MFERGKKLNLPCFDNFRGRMRTFMPSFLSSANLQLPMFYCCKGESVLTWCHYKHTVFFHVFFACDCESRSPWRLPACSSRCFLDTRAHPDLCNLFATTYNRLYTIIMATQDGRYRENTRTAVTRWHGSSEPSHCARTACHRDSRGISCFRPCHWFDCPFCGCFPLKCWAVLRLANVSGG